MIPLLITILFLTAPLAAAETAALPAPDSPAAIGWIIGVLAGLLFIGNQILTCIGHFRQNPPNHTLYATKSDLLKLETDLDARIAGLSESSAKSREKVYIALTEIRDAVARLETQGTEQTRQLARLDLKLDHVAERATLAQATATAAQAAAATAQATAEAARHFSP